MSNESINFSKILTDSKETLLNPKGYFESMPLSGGITEAIIKAAIYGAVAGVFAFIWSLLGWSAVGFGGILGTGVGIMALIWSIIGAVIGLFIGGALMLVVSAICGGNTDFEANVRVTASIMVIYPISAFLALFYGISFTLGGIVGLVVNLYSIYLVYNAVIYALKGKESSVKIVGIVLILLVLLGFFGGRRASKSLRDFSDMYDYEMLD